MSYNVFSAANFVINRAIKDRIDLTSLRLEHILFYLDGYYLAEYGEELIDGDFINGTYGPYVKELQDYYREYGSQPLISPAMRFNPADLSISDYPEITKEDVGSERYRGLMDFTRLLLSKWPVWRLIDHIKEDTAYLKVCEKYSDSEVKQIYLYTFE